MRTFAVRKKHTGEPTANVGQFGTHNHAEPAVDLNAQEAGVEGLHASGSSVLPAAPTVTGERVTKDIVRKVTVGAKYTPDFVGTDAVVPQAQTMLDAAVLNGELDNRLTYSVEARNSGVWMAQSLIVTAVIPRELQLEFNDGGDPGRTQHFFETHAVLSRIATAWQRKVTEPLSPYVECNYGEEIRFALAD